jgi:hypothetical protein
MTWVPVGVPPRTEGEQQVMIVDKGMGGNKRSPHMPEDIEVFHTLVVVGVVERGEWYYQLVRLLSETSQVCLGQTTQVLGDQEVQCTNTLIVNR